MSQAERTMIGEVVACKSDLFRPDFFHWLETNFHVWAEFERRALKAAQHRTHYSSYTLLEVMRHDTAIGELGGEYKLDNSYCADLCRLFALMNPQHAGLFEFRARRAA